MTKSNVDNSDRVVTLSTGKVVSITPAVRKLIDSCFVINGKGQDVSVATLKIIAPNHSNRDYALAHEVYQDTKNSLMVNPVPIPEHIHSIFSSCLRMMWASVCKHYGECINNMTTERARTEQAFKDEINRYLSEKEMMETELARLKKEIQDLRLQHEELAAANREKDKRLSELTTANAEFAGMYKVLKENYDMLTEWKKNPATYNGNKGSNKAEEI